MIGLKDVVARIKTETRSIWIPSRMIAVVVGVT
jgi:hypothetical protein